MACQTKNGNWPKGAMFEKMKGSMSNLAVKTVAATALLVCAGAAFAQSANGSSANAEMQNVLQLSASGEVEVQQDLLVIRLAASKDGADAASVQSQLKQVLDAALTQAKTKAQPQQMDVRTGDFSLNPRYNTSGKITGWQGRAELILEGKDFSRISTMAGSLPNMTISSINFDLSRAERVRVEGDAQAKAIEAFKARAQEVTKSFGFNNYSLREVAVSDRNAFPMMDRARGANGGVAMMAKMASDVPVEAGKANVQITVSGTVQMR